MNWPAQGVHEGVPFATYRADDVTTADDAETIKSKAVSKSMICAFSPDPAAWKAAPPRTTTKAMQAGSLFDCLLTEPDEMENRFVVSPFDSFRTNEAKVWKAEVEASGVSVITGDDIKTAHAQLAAVMAKPESRNIIENSRKQVAFRYNTKHGFASKGLIDLAPNNDDCLVDLKTCEPRALDSQRSLQKHIAQWGYHIQAGSYCEGMSIASGAEIFRFKFIFVSSAPPFRVAVIELPLAAILFGADQYRAGVAKFANCIKTNTWPSIWDGEVELDLPQYAYTESE